MFSFIRRKTSKKEIPQIIPPSWDIDGINILHPKYKFEFTLTEKELLKNMLKESPPPLHSRRKVRKFI